MNTTQKPLLPNLDTCFLTRLSDSDGAASVIRTRDLTLTKGALYRWSYGSISIDAHGLHERRSEVKFFKTVTLHFAKNMLALPAE